MKLINATALAATAAVIQIFDFQGQVVDLSQGRTGDFVAISAYEVLNNDNQFWAVVAANNGLFQLINPTANSIMSYASAPVLGTGGLILHQQVMGHSVNDANTTWFINATANGSAMFIESSSGLALSSWPLNPQNSEVLVPLTLEEANGNPTQLFTIKPAA
ncbi:hypothetical protein EIP91_011426 [Steccherinum ochraceum]|uniref:Uncharacterized protein n=1 Tax=Steccherinum ochraceum TaxID=92696 RepID=A0A4R0RW30_9APHY|nr:hypothetical protein EIP91_011426 [Steccherinum ochraceum]